MISQGAEKNDSFNRRKQCLKHLYSAHKANIIMKLESIDGGGVDIGKEKEKSAGEKGGTGRCMGKEDHIVEGEACKFEVAPAFDDPML